MKLILEILYKMKKFKPVLLCGNNSKLCAEIIYFLLKDDFAIKTYFSPSEFINPLDTLGSNALIFVFDLKKETKKIVEMFGGIDSPILVLNGEEKADDLTSQNIDYLMQNLSPSTYIFYNADDVSTYNNIKKEERTIKTCSINNKGTIYASDISNTGTDLNFKINYQGKTIPFWAKGQFSQDQYYSVLSAILVAMTMGVNLVEISNRLREFQIN